MLWAVSKFKLGFRKQNYYNCTSCIFFSLVKIICISIFKYLGIMQLVRVVLFMWIFTYIFNRIWTINITSINSIYQNKVLDVHVHFCMNVSACGIAEHKRSLSVSKTKFPFMFAVFNVCLNVWQTVPQSIHETICYVIVNARNKYNIENWWRDEWWIEKKPCKLFTIPLRHTVY